MAGKVRSREDECPNGHGRLTINEESDIRCSTCNYRPKTYYIFLYTGGNKHRITRDLDGHILDSYRRAHRLLEHIRKDIDDGIFNAANYLPKEIEQFKGGNMLDRWLKAKTEQGLSQWHIHKIKQYVRRFYKPYFRDIDTRRIARYQIEDFLAELPNGLSLKTKKNIMTMLRNFCRWLYDREILGRVPAFPLITPEEPPIVFIMKDQQLQYLKSIPPEHRPIFQFLMYHPVRIGEACALQVKHFDLKNMIVEISQSVGYGREIKSRKNKKPYYLPLSRSFDASILKGKLPGAFVFTSKGKIYSSDNLGNIWRNAISAAGMTPIQLKNATRHSVASQAVNSGIGLERVSKALGHSSLEMTKRYASMNVELLKDVIDGAEKVCEPFVNQNI